MDENRWQTACFTGHRKLKEPTAELKRRVSAVVEELIQREYRYFSVGGARGFDYEKGKVMRSEILEAAPKSSR